MLSSVFSDILSMTCNVPTLLRFPSLHGQKELQQHLFMSGSAPPAAIQMQIHVGNLFQPLFLVAHWQLFSPPPCCHQSSEVLLGPGHLSEFSSVHVCDCHTMRMWLVSIFQLYAYLRSCSSIQQGVPGGDCCKPFPIVQCRKESMPFICVLRVAISLSLSI